MDIHHMLCHYDRGKNSPWCVRDLETTLQEKIEEQQYIMLGHSQGGLIVQSAMQNSKVLYENTLGCVLLGTFPLV